ncbi:hypothetical protein BDZ97DRAFT_813472 [Flammula alnicola]|nr:hypothetical protein BDZ97DRAFT_813472 [Flammula alnicola]
MHDLDFTSVAGNRMVMVNGPIIKIWDFVTNAWVTWNTTHSSRQVMVLVAPSDLSLWDIPPLSLKAHSVETGTEPSEPSQPRLRLSYPEGFKSPSRSECSGICDWYTGSRQPLWFDITANELSTFNFTRFKIDVPDIHLPAVPITSISSFHIPYYRHTYWTPYRVCGEDISFLWCNSTAIFLHTGGTSSLEATNCKALLRKAEHVDQRQASFCPSIICRRRTILLCILRRRKLLTHQEQFFYNLVNTSRVINNTRNHVLETLEVNVGPALGSVRI